METKLTMLEAGRVAVEASKAASKAASEATQAAEEATEAAERAIDAAQRALVAAAEARPPIAQLVRLAEEATARLRVPPPFQPMRDEVRSGWRW